MPKTQLKNLVVPNTPFCEEKICTFKILQEHKVVCHEIGVFHDQVEIAWMPLSFPYKALSFPRNEPGYTKTELRQH